MHKFILLPLLMLLAGCQALPQLYQAVEDIANDEAIEVMVSREAISKQTDVNVTIEVKNNQQPAK